MDSSAGGPHGARPGREECQESAVEAEPAGVVFLGANGKMAQARCTAQSLQGLVLRHGGCSSEGQKSLGRSIC